MPPYLNRTMGLHICWNEQNLTHHFRKRRNLHGSLGGSVLNRHPDVTRWESMCRVVLLGVCRLVFDWWYASIPPSIAPHTRKRGGGRDDKLTCLQTGCVPSFSLSHVSVCAFCFEDTAFRRVTHSHLFLANYTQSAKCKQQPVK